MGLLTRHCAPLRAALLLAGIASVVAPARAPAVEYTASLDLRAIVTDATPSFLDGGLGKFRYGESGLALGRLRLALDEHYSDTLLLHAEASSWGDHDRAPIDLTEAFAQWRPYPHDGWRVRVKGGMFYPPSSVENRAEGWESPYTISSSALNSWIAEEIRTIGVEASLDFLGQQLGGDQDLGVFAALYGWNDPAGVMVSDHGFALHDRQTTLFGRVGASADYTESKRELFHEIDHRAGYYVGGRWRLRDRLETRVMHYDNRADPTRPMPSINDYAWLTRFDTVGLRFEAGDDLTLTASWLAGDTEIAPQGARLVWDYSTWFVLANRRFGPHAATLRYDDFRMHMTRNAFGPATHRDTGTAWTVAYSYERPRSPWRFMAELTRADSFATERDEYGLDAVALETKLELSLRYTLRSSETGR